MLDIKILPAPSPTALAIYDSLVALGIGIAGSWTDCATRLEIAASEAGSHGMKSKLRDCADDCRSRARKLAVWLVTP